MLTDNRQAPDISGLKKFHFIGIGGVGMSALAHILLARGYQVSGSDLHGSAYTQALAKAGAKIYDGHAADNVADVDAVVVSSAIHAENPELEAAREKNIRLLHRSDINAALMNAADGIAVAGAHGKTTTSSMIGVMLTKTDQDPTVIVGGIVRDLGSNARLGKGPLLVTEADESDGSFLKLRPNIAVVTNVEDDHLDYYGTVEKIQAAFAEFLANVKPGGCAVVCFDNATAKELAGKTATRVVSYAIDAAADYRAVDITPTDGGTAFAVEHDGEILGRVELSIPGRHNVLNALAALAVSRIVGVDFAAAARALGEFHGAKRRFESKGRINNIWIVDDYAHHPTELASTIAAARQTNPRRLIGVFQPHRYTRTKLLAEEFGGAFAGLDELIMTDIYSAGEEPIPGIDGQTIPAAVKRVSGQTVRYVARREELADYLAAIVRPGDLVLTMGAGDIDKTGPEILDRLKNEGKYE